MKKEQFDITGMTCSACSTRVEQCVAKLPGVAEAAVSLQEKAAKVKLTQDVTDEVFKTAVETAGYQLTEIK